MPTAWQIWSPSESACTSPHILLGSPNIAILFIYAEISALFCFLSDTPNLPTILLDFPPRLQAAGVFALFPSPSHSQLVNLCY